MKVIINGKHLNISEKNLSELIQRLGFADKRIAVEYNQRIIPKVSYQDTKLYNGDCIEIIHAVGGG